MNPLKWFFFSNKPLLFFLLNLVLLSTLPKLSAANTGTKLVIAGSGTNLSITRLLAKTFTNLHPEIAIEIPESIGSGAAIKAVTDGAIPLGLISRPLEEKEKKYGITALPYARTALVIGVHPSVTEDNISYQELLDIYRGKKNRWKNGKEIIVLTREPGESSVETLRKDIPGFASAYDESQAKGMWSTLRKDQVMNQTLAKTPNAIGLSDLGTMTVEHLAIKPLKVSGIAPTSQNVQNGKYRFFKTLSIVYKKENLSRPAKLFIDFIQSKKAEQILNANGFALTE